MTAVIDTRPGPASAEPAEFPGRADHTDRGLAAMPAKLGWTVVALFVGFMGVQTWTASLSVPGADLAAVALILTGLVYVWIALKSPRGLSRSAQMVLLIALSVGIGYQAVLTWLFDPAYGTDAAAFDQYAAFLTLHGSDPYSHSMAPSLAQFHVPAIFHTFRLDGGTVADLSYPAGSFLLYLPLLAVGVTTQAANIVDLMFWLAGMFLMWRLLPRDASWVAPLIAGGVLYLGFVIGGLTDALFVPFLLVAVYRWDRFADLTLSRTARWAGPIALGAAVAIKQTPWFFVPFLLVGVFVEARVTGVRPRWAVARYAGLAGSVFLATNLPFIVINPGSWFHGALVPFVTPTIPDGQGLITLTLFERLGGGNLTLFTVLGALFTFAAFSAFILRYESLKRAWVPLVAVSFFFPTRSFSSYLFMLIPAALIAGTSVRGTNIQLFPRVAKHSRALLTLAVIVIGGCGTYALTAAPPLSIHVVAKRSTGQILTINELTVQVTNRTGTTVTPHFTVNATGHVTTFWYALGTSGITNVTIGPHQQQTITLHAPNVASMPSAEEPLLVEAFTTQPASISVSGRYDPSPLGTRMVPDAVDAPAQVGQPVALTVQAQNKYGVPVHRAGIPVTLSQVVYGENSYYSGEASINGHPEGFSPVVVKTDANGQAHFTVRGVQPQSEPVTFQAWIVDANGSPHGYSNQTSVQFVAKK